MKGLNVLFENESILVLVKPAGLSVQGGRGVKSSLDALLALSRSPPPRLVHRLDKDTSGLMVTAKTKDAACRLSALFARGGIQKRYLAVCAGALPERGTISGELEIRGRAKKAETFYKRNALGCLPGGLPGNAPGGPPPYGGPSGAEGSGGGVCSLALLEPATGREHQLRRHLADLGFPILGDDKYGDFSLNRGLKKTWGLKRLLLHACFLSIPPESLCTGGAPAGRAGSGPAALTLTAPPPDYFTAFLEKAGMAGSLKIHGLDTGNPFFP
jgi:23S rRNA pseudouridine955/2504/2580 synthase